MDFSEKIGVMDLNKDSKMSNIKINEAIVTNSIDNFGVDEDGYRLVKKRFKKNLERICESSDEEQDKIVYNRRQRKAYKKELDKLPASKVEVCGVELCYMRTSNLPPQFVRNTARKVVNIGGGTQMWRCNRKYDVMHVRENSRSTTYKCNAQYKQKKHLEIDSIKKKYCAICDEFFLDEDVNHFSFHDDIILTRKKEYYFKNKDDITAKKKVNIVKLMDEYNMEYQKKNKDGSFVVDEEEEIVIMNQGRFAMMSDAGLHKWIMAYIENDSYLEKLFFLTQHKNDSVYSRIWKCLKSRTYVFSCNFDVDSEVSDEFEDFCIDLPFDHFITDT